MSTPRSCEQRWRFRRRPMRSAVPPPCWPACSTSSAGRGSESPPLRGRGKRRAQPAGRSVRLPRQRLAIRARELTGPVRRCHRGGPVRAGAVHPGRSAAAATCTRSTRRARLAGCCSPPSSGRSTSTGTGGWPRRLAVAAEHPVHVDQATARATGWPGGWLRRRRRCAHGGLALDHPAVLAGGRDRRRSTRRWRQYGAHSRWPGCRWSSAPAPMHSPRCPNCGPRCGPPGTASAPSAARHRPPPRRTGPARGGLERRPAVAGPVRPALKSGRRWIERFRPGQLGRIRRLEQRPPRCEVRIGDRVSGVRCAAQPLGDPVSLRGRLDLQVDQLARGRRPARPAPAARSARRGPRRRSPAPR